MKPRALMLSAAVLLGSTAVALAQANSPPTVAPSSPTSGAMTQPATNNPSPSSQPASKAGASAAKSSNALPASNGTKQVASQPPHTSKHRAMAARHVTPRSSEANRATAALNLLEEKGYRDFSSFHRTGRDYEITAEQNGKSVNVVVDPHTKSVRTRG